MRLKRGNIFKEKKEKEGKRRENKGERGRLWLCPGRDTRYMRGTSSARKSTWTAARQKLKTKTKLPLSPN